jgi:hypothetical protein
MLRGFPTNSKASHSARNKTHLDVLFFISVNSALKRFPFLLDTTGIGVLPRNFRHSSLLTVNFKNSPSAIYVSAAKRVCQGVDSFKKPISSLNQILR